jgi:hypothetical protein
MDTENKTKLNRAFCRLTEVAFTKKRLLLFFLFTSLFSSCETITEIDLPVEKPQLVINSIFNADSILTVNVTKSHPTSTRNLYFVKVENAVIEVLKNKQSIGLLSYAGKGNYKASSKFPNEPGAEYAIKAKAADFETAEATEIIPAKPVIASFKIEGVNNDNSSYKTYKVRFSLPDPTENNFYLLRIWLVNPNGFKSPIQFELKNALGQFSPLRSENLQLSVFNDQSFNGKELALDLDIFQMYINKDYKGTHKIIVELSTINKSYFDYLYSVERQFEDIPLLEPKNLPVSNNIKNGLGIFAPYNAATVEFDVLK